MRVTNNKNDFFIVCNGDGAEEQIFKVIYTNMLQAVTHSRVLFTIRNIHDIKGKKVRVKCAVFVLYRVY